MEIMGLTRTPFLQQWASETINQTPVCPRALQTHPGPSSGFPMKTHTASTATMVIATYHLQDRDTTSHHYYTTACISETRHLGIGSVRAQTWDK